MTRKVQRDVKTKTKSSYTMALAFNENDKNGSIQQKVYP